ncbi:MAG TPA: selenide, water dikinase SelD [Actinomycetota bacterium]|jgi:selenide,water dikinase|nr:selenide, water dikinase SelD [Actinomycetota bacterium]
MDRSLTSFSHGAGCACKLSPQDLSEVLERLGPSPTPADVVVATDTKDDAAVYRLPDGTGLIQTVDFFTPIVDDPFDWGRVAAANAISDVYAMGGRPILALNLVAWPVDDLPLELLTRVLEGGAKVADEAGAAVVGGHSIHDPEPKYGMAVTGLVSLDRLVRNSTAPVGARLFLTKPLGVGMITTGIKRGAATEEQARAAVDLMATLNGPASEAMVEAGAEAATDVTGYGLLGHLLELLEASGVAAEIDAGAIPVLPGALDLARRGVIAGGTRRNRTFVEPHVAWGDLDEAERFVLADAQTSGGLLIAASGKRAEALEAGLRDRAVPAAEIGRTIEGRPGRVEVRGRLAG